MTEHPHSGPADPSLRASIPARFSLNPFWWWRREGALTPLEIAEGGLLADVSVLLSLASIYLPVIGGIIAVAVPTPFVLLVLRRGWRASVLGGVVAVFLVTVISGPHFGWRLGTQVLVGLAIGLAMRRRLNPWIAVLGAAAIIALALFLATLALIFLAGLPVHDLVVELQNGFAAGAATIRAASPSLWRTIQPGYQAMAAFAVAWWPLLLYVMLYVSGVATAAWYYFVAQGVLRVLGYDVPVFPPHWMRQSMQGLVAHAEQGWQPRRSTTSPWTDEPSSEDDDR